MGAQRSHKRRHAERSQVRDRAAEMFATACAEHRNGKLPEAKSLYRKLLTFQPRHADARHLLGFAEFQSSQFTAAVEHLTAAVGLRPEDAEFRNNLALAYLASEQLEAAQSEAAQARDLGHRDGHGYLHVGWEFFQRQKTELAEAAYRLSLVVQPESTEPHNYLGVLAAERQRWSEAEAHYRRALELSPTSVEVLNNLGNALRDQDRAIEALPYYRQAIAIDPRFAAAHNNLGVAFASIGDSAAAAECYREALRWHPQFVEALNNLGNACRDLGQVAEAINYYRQATQLSPRSAEILSNLGASLRQQGQVSEAIAIFRRAIMLQPRSVKIHQQLATSLAQRGDVEAASDCCRHIARLDPQQPLWELRTAAVCPVVFQSRTEMNAARDGLLQRLAETQRRGFDLKFNEWIETAPHCPFELQFFEDNLRGIKEAYAALFHSYLAPLAGTTSIPSSRGSSARPRIGFVVTDSHEGVFLKSLRGVLERLSKRWELVVLCSRQGAPRLRAEISRDDLRVIPLSTRLDHMARDISNVRCDLLYYWEVGTDAANYFLPFLRLAPVQVTSWGVQVTSGITSLDAYLSSDLVEPADAQEHYTEPLRLARTLLTYRPRTRLPDKVAARDTFPVPASAHWYVCAQQLGKFHVEFDALLAGILRQDPLGVVLITGDAHGTQSRRLGQRFARTMPDVADRIHILPRLDHHTYLSLLHHADVLLDPLHFGGVNSTYDGLSLGQPIVVLPSGYHRGRYTLGCYRKMGVSDCIAVDSKHYVELAVQIGRNADFRQELRQRLFPASDVLFEDHTAVSEHEGIFAELLDRSPS